MDVNNVTVRSSSFWDFKGPEEYLDKWFMMGTPLPLLATLATYLLFVLKIGPAFMKNREPYSLRKTILIYNIIQVLYSAYLCNYGFRILWEHGAIIQSACLITNEKFRYTILNGFHLYTLAKMSELLDTVFFVLRKKWNQVSFLHVYHHFIMCVLSWSSMKFEPSDNLIFFGTLNSFVHVIMYGYYGLSAFPSLRKHLWWKKYITKIQLVQFMMVFIQIQLSSLISECPPSYILVGVTSFHVLLFLYLFGKFYVKSYMDKRKEEENIRANKQTSQIKSNVISSTYKANEVLNNRLSEKSR